MYRKRKILKSGRRAARNSSFTDRGSYAKGNYDNGYRSSGSYGYTSNDGYYSKNGMNSTHKEEKICRISASETRAGGPGYRNGYGERRPAYSGYRESGTERNSAGSYSRNDRSSKAETCGKRRIFSMAAWTASFIMVLNMLPADSPVSQVISKYEESLPALSFGLEELKNGPSGVDGADADKDATVNHDSVPENSSAGEENGSGLQEINGTDAPDSVKTSADSTNEGQGAANTETIKNRTTKIENIALVTSAEPVIDEIEENGNTDNGAAASTSGQGAVRAASSENSGIVTFNGIKLILSDSADRNGTKTYSSSIDNSSGAAGAAASGSNTGSAAPSTTTGSPAGGAASPQPQNGSSLGGTAVLTKNAADSSKTVKVSSATGSGDIIIYHTHATEAYAPVANAETTHSADTAGTVREAGNNLTAALKAKGYNVIHDTTLHDSPSYNKSYNRSLETLKKLLKEHASPKLVIDFHRDAATATGKAKTAVVNGETVASFALVVGTKNDNYKEIRAFADKIVKKTNELYPGLCTGVIEKPYKFNGYLSNNYILLELGNNANTITQINAAVPYLADALTNILQ